MELNYDNSFDDLVVPEDKEIYDRLPSPGSWSKWGSMASQGLFFHSYDKQGGTETDDTTDMVEDEAGLMEEFLSNEISDSRMRRPDGLAASSEDSLGRTAFSDDSPDDQHDYLEGIGQMDDSFLNSFIEGLPQSHGAPGSFFYSPSTDSCEIPADYLRSDMDVDSPNFQSDAHSIGRGRYSKKQASSPSCSLEGRPTGCPQSEVPTSFLSEQSAKDGHFDEGSMEESVLQELEMVLRQLTSSTRICFRDALYRLAQNSRQHEIVHDDPSSSAVKKTLESETNPVDRAVANLMFNKMDVNVQDFAVPASLCSTFGFTDSSHAVNHKASNRAQGDVEVPVFDLVGQQVAL